MTVFEKELKELESLEGVFFGTNEELKKAVFQRTRSMEFFQNIHWETKNLIKTIDDHHDIKTFSFQTENYDCELVIHPQQKTFHFEKLEKINA